MKKTTYTLLILSFFLPFSSNGQYSLALTNCASTEFEINDHSDSDEDGNVCEAKIILSNSAFYTENELCALSGIKWAVIVDLNGDGTDDLEYSSSLPSDDDTLDDTNENGIPDIYIPVTLSGEIQSIQLPDIEGPMSNLSVQWSVFDDCGSVNICDYGFSVVDKKAPSPFCVSLSTAIFDGFEFEIFAEDIVVGVFDNCTENENIRYSFSGDSIVPSRLVTCNDVVNSPVSIDVYVWDDSDNSNFCTFFLTVIPEPFVDCLLTGEIAGFVKTWDDKPMKGVEVTLEADLIEFPITAITDANGKYSFGNFPDGIYFEISARFEENYLDGVSTLDLVMIVRHILGIAPFTNPFQIIAADINGDYSVKANDLLSLRKLIIGVISELPTNSSWKFIDADYEFENPSNPFPDLLDEDDDPFVIELNQINTDGYDFTGIKIGDLSNY